MSEIPLKLSLAQIFAKQRFVMVKFPEATARLFRNIYVCKKCKSKIRAQPLKVIQKRISCRKCGHKDLRPVKKK